VTGDGGAASARRAAYADGIIAASAALMRDLERLGFLGDAEVLSRGEDGAGSVCCSCQMRRLGYTGLANRLEFAIDVTSQGAA
jgi:hypothetical protein